MKWKCLTRWLWIASTSAGIYTIFIGRKGKATLWFRGDEPLGVYRLRAAAMMSASIHFAHGG